MVKKEGPCCHCRVISNLLWRNGPPEKPVLCNACGTRWRKKGTLEKDTPTRRRPQDAEAERKQPKKKPVVRRIVKKQPSSDHNLGKTGDAAHTFSNPSGFGSALSYSGSAQSHARESLLPSRKKTCVDRRRKPSSLETLVEDLNSIMHEEQLRSGSGVRTIPGSSEEDLLIYHSETAAGSFEIGYGSMLLTHPSKHASY
ncbi:GATA transcription factor 27-like [Aegilops tauschii subsp. strangulata]|uniref:GATA-type domain-containing protein n=1 Tax=Aegilops tauschii subsp. strangulata TaxID=200361 RepID=A0A453DM73_AEGTS|nr:GATA transcription factor 27-like [Aegilops tauschii subsp. strangulata]